QQHPKEHRKPARTLHACLQRKHTPASKSWQPPRKWASPPSGERATEQQPRAGIVHSFLHERTPCPGKKMTWETNLTPNAALPLPKHPVIVDPSPIFRETEAFFRHGPQSPRKPPPCRQGALKRPVTTTGTRDLALLTRWMNSRHQHMDTGNTEKSPCWHRFHRSLTLQRAMDETSAERRTIRRQPAEHLDHHTRNHP